MLKISTVYGGVYTCKVRASTLKPFVSWVIVFPTAKDAYIRSWYALNTYTVVARNVQEGLIYTSLARKGLKNVLHSIHTAIFQKLDFKIFLNNLKRIQYSSGLQLEQILKLSSRVWRFFAIPEPKPSNIPSTSDTVPGNSESSRLGSDFKRILKLKRITRKTSVVDSFEFWTISMQFTKRRPLKHGSFPEIFFPERIDL